MKFYLFKDQANYWRWRLVASSGKVIAESPESYWNKQDALDGISLVKIAYNAPVYE
jgi:uncharacterized protein YegP (UPF0339 family)